MPAQQPTAAKVRALSERLLDWRTQRRWTRAMAAEHLNVSERTYENWELGANEPRGIGLQALNKAISSAKP
jgi:DNA-binding transcriptional regulator YiaG